MSSKLTLSIEKKVIESAKKYARRKGQSLSGMVEDYLKFLTTNSNKSNKTKLSPKVQDLKGIIKTKENIDYKKILTEELSKKYEL